MIDQQNPAIETAEREDNPKAVFIGTESEVINPLALYLDKHSVDLFIGKNLNDAFFGEYFFYVGTSNGVKNFIEQKGQELPKTLLLLTEFSDLDTFQQLVSSYQQIKIVLLGDIRYLEEAQVLQIIEYFYAGATQVFDLGQKKNLKQYHLDNVIPIETEEVKPALEPTATDSQIKIEEKAVDPKDTPAALMAVTELKDVVIKPQTDFHADFTVDEKISEQTKESVKNLYENLPPKGSGNAQDQKKRAPIVFLCFIGVLFFIVFPILAYASEIAATTFFLYQAKNKLETLDFEKSSRHFDTARVLAQTADDTLDLFSSLLLVTKQRGLLSQLKSLDSILKNASLGGRSLSLGLRDGHVLLRGIAGKDKGVSYGQLISSAKGYLSLADTEFAQVQAELKTRPLFMSTFWEKWSRSVGDLREGLYVGRSVLTLLPEVIGLYGERTYLVLFQNNMEIRPTGGFIGSFGLIDFADGQLKDIRIEDVYTADGALKGHIDPPDPIREHLAAEHWYLRDSNWDPDFAKSGSRALWFLNKELEISADGVVALDVSFMQNLLSVIGPLTISDDEESITADTVFSLLHQKIQADFFPGSTQKKDLLAVLAQKILSVLLDEEGLAKPDVIRAVYKGFLEKHALVYLASAEMQKIVSLLSWAGEVAPNKNCDVSNCIPDYLLVVDANLGVNKSNFYVTKQVTDRVQISESGEVVHRLGITYKNDSPTDSTKIGGTFKNYVRIFAPKDAELINAWSDETQLQFEQGTVASASSVLSSTENDFATFATLVEVLPKTEKTLTLEYKNINASSTAPRAYAMTLQKQPGTTRDQYAVTLEYPASWKLEPGSENVAGATTLVNNSQITYNTVLTADTVLKFNFTH